MAKSATAPQKKLRSESNASSSAASTLPRDHAPLDRELLKRLYASMLRCRLVHDRAAGVARAAESSLRPASGREAIEVGCTIDLAPEDVAFCPANSVAGPILMGAPVASVVGHFTPSSSTSAFPSNIISLPPSADALALAAGIGYSFRHLSKPNIVFALDAGTVPARAVEAFSLISRDKLPVIAVIENIGRGSHPQRLLDSARAHGIPCITVDANDVVAVYRVAREAIHRARTHRGATVIDCYPLPARRGESPDPIRAMQHYLTRFNLWSDEWKAELEQKHLAELGA